MNIKRSKKFCDDLEKEQSKPVKTKEITKAYNNRLQDAKHPQKITTNFEGTFYEFKSIVKFFGEWTKWYFVGDNRAQFYPIRRGGWKEIAADFSYCYEMFREEILTNWCGQDYSEWEPVNDLFERVRVNEAYNSINKI